MKKSIFTEPIQTPYDHEMVDYFADSVSWLATRAKELGFLKLSSELFFCADRALALSNRLESFILSDPHYASKRHGAMCAVTSVMLAYTDLQAEFNRELLSLALSDPERLRKHAFEVAARTARSN